MNRGEERREEKRTEQPSDWYLLIMYMDHNIMDRHIRRIMDYKQSSFYILELDHPIGWYSLESDKKVCCYIVDAVAI